MRTVSTYIHLTLDGVMQAPADPDEDRRDGFEHGGWEPPYGDEVMGRMATEGMGEGGALLLGRRTYEHMASYWPTAPQPNPFTDWLNQAQKYVASRTLREPLPWENSTLLQGDAGDAVATLKEQDGDDLLVLGSGDLMRTLIERDLVDRYTLLIHPLVLGSGRRLFEDGGPGTKLRLVDTTNTTTGVIIATYERAGE